MSTGTTISFAGFKSLTRPVWKDRRYHKMKFTA